MRPLLKTIILVSIVAFTPSLARGQNAPSDANGIRRDGTAVGGGSAAAPSLEEWRKQYVALLQLKDALQKYLATLSPGSAEHQTTANSLREVEEKKARVERSMLDILASPALSESAVVTPPDAGTSTPRRQPPPTGGAARVGARARAGLRASAEEAVTPDAPPSAPVEEVAVAPTGPQEDEEPSGQSDDEEPAADPAAPTPTPQGFVAWLNSRVEEKTIALINQGSPSNQTETPSASSGSTSLVDKPAASDLIGVGLNLAGLAGGTASDDSEATSTSVTTSAYSLFATFKGADPLDPAFYNRHKGWRSVSFTLGFDNEKREGVETTDKVTLAGFKWLIIDKRDAAIEENADERKAIFQALINAASAFGKLDEEVQGFLFRRKSVRDKFLRDAFAKFLDGQISRIEPRVARLQQQIEQAEAGQEPKSIEEVEAELSQVEALLTSEQTTPTNRTRRATLRRLLLQKQQLKVLSAQLHEFEKAKAMDFERDNVLDPDKKPEQWTWAERRFYRIGFNREILRDTTKFQEVLAALTPEERDTLDSFVDARVSPFVELKKATRAQLQEIRAKPQLSFSFLSKRRDEGNDEYTSDLIYERGMGGGRMFATLNAGFKYKDSKFVGGDSRGGKVAGQLQFQVTPEESLISKSPIFLYVSGDAEWLSGEKPKYRAQAKVKVPITDGIDIPISVTFANRTDLIDESDVRGQFGFTFDTAKILRVFKFKLPTLGARVLDFAPLFFPALSPQAEQ